MPWDSVDRKRDEDRVTLWTRDASRAIASGEYTGAIAILIESGSTQEEAERFVAASLAVNMPFPLNGVAAHRSLSELVDVATNIMGQPDWSFAQVADALERAQAERR